MNEIKIKVKEEAMRKVTIVDKTDFVPGLSTNGGHYKEWVTYKKIAANQYEVTYGSGSEFDFCSIIGLYESCFSCPWNEDGECTGKPEIVDEDTVKKAIEYANYHMDELHHPDAVGGYEVIIE